MYRLPPQYSTGNEAIDQQHTKILELLAQASESIKNGKDEKTLTFSEFISALKTYSHTHFQSEERQMEKINYPKLQDHKKLHAEFEGKVNALNSKKRVGEQEKMKELALFLKEWFVGHIVENDLPFGIFWKEHEEKERRKNLA